MRGESAAPRVLVVEDDEVVSFVQARYLSLHGFEVTVASAAIAAIDALSAAEAANKPFAHVVLDLRLGSVDGEIVLDHCERQARRPTVVVCAAPESVDSHRMLRLRGRCEYLPKPFVGEALVVMLTTGCGRSVQDYARAFELSRQEAAVVEHAVEGLDDYGIASAIGCRPGTVKTYWARIYDKVKVRSHDAVLAHLVRWLTNAHPPKLQSGVRRAVRVRPDES